MKIKTLLIFYLILLLEPINILSQTISKDLGSKDGTSYRDAWNSYHVGGSCISGSKVLNIGYSATSVDNYGGADWAFELPSEIINKNQLVSIIIVVKGDRCDALGNNAKLTFRAEDGSWLDTKINYSLSNSYGNNSFSVSSSYVQDCVKTYNGGLYLFPIITSSDNYNVESIQISIEYQDAKLCIGDEVKDYGDVSLGSNPSTRTFTVSVKNCGLGVLTGTVSSGVNWLTVSPTSYSLSANSVQNITVTATTSSLSSGNYSGNIVFSSNGGSINHPAAQVKIFDKTLIIEEVNSTISIVGKRPLLLVHGWQPSPVPAPYGGDIWDNFIEYFNTQEDLKNTFKIYKVLYLSNLVSVEDLGKEFRIKLDEFSSNNEFNNFTIIAHSMGGLVSRSFMNYQKSDGPFASQKGGERVEKMITLGTPHHGSPMANGESRKSGVSGIDAALLNVLLRTVELNLLLDQPDASQFNRFDLHWDNIIDNRFDYQKYPEEKNEWLVQLNSDKSFDNKIITYYSIFNPSDSTNTSKKTFKGYKFSSILMDMGMGMSSDGIVPEKSAYMSSHNIRGRRSMGLYNHTQLAKGKYKVTDTLFHNDDLFFKLKHDLLDIVEPLLTIFPVDIFNYDDVVLNEKSEKIFTIKNDGNTNLSISDINLSGNNFNQFHIISPSSLTFDVEPNLSVDIVIEFNPTSEGLKTASLNITNNDPNNSPIKTINLSGKGVLAPTKYLEVNPSDILSFEHTFVNEISLNTINIKNSGTLEVTGTLSLLGLDPSEFTILGPINLNLDKGDYNNIYVQFNPSSVGEKKATLLITNNSDNTPNLEIELNGNGIEDSSDIYGFLNVSILPSEVVTVGAQWSIDNGVTWQESGTTLDNIPIGSYTIIFKDVLGWIKPENQTAIINSNLITNLSGIYSLDSQISTWDDGFETYEFGSFPSNWVADANATNISTNFVDNEYSNQGNQSLKLYGSVGACWGSLSYRPITIGQPFEIEIAIRNGSETLTGCHPDRAGFGLRQGMSWSNPDRSFINFKGDGTIIGGGGLSLGNYSVLAWYLVKVRYEKISDTTIQLSYWINNSYKGSEILASILDENQLTNLQLVVQEGTAWFDDIKINSYSSDEDGDGVEDNIDTCPNTLAGEIVDVNGCSSSQLDEDGDGVMDNIDTCPNTLAGETVDSNGCSESQLDDDGDGIMNDVDICTATPSGDIVDANGCSNNQLDDDNDGVNNDVDNCPDTPYPTEGITIAGGNGDGSAANQLNYPYDLFIDLNDNIYVADYSNHRIQKWAQGSSEGITVAGGNGQGSALNQLAFPTGVFVDLDENIYVSDSGNHRIQKWAQGSSEGTTVAGGNGQGSALNQLAFPVGVFVDLDGNIYVSDNNNHRIQKFTPSSSSSSSSSSSLEGVTVGLGNGDYSFDPYKIFVDLGGNIYATDRNNHRIQKFTSSSSEGITVAGGNGQGSALNQLSLPTGVFVDSKSNIFIADQLNRRVQMWMPGSSEGQTILSNSNNGIGNLSDGIFIDLERNIYLSDITSHSIQKWVATKVDQFGCPIFTLPFNNFNIAVTSETCPDKNNGQIVITATESHNYVATINGTDYTFTNSKTITDLPPGSYSLKITITGKTFEQWFTVEILEGTSVSGKSAVKANKATVEIVKGTAPYQVFVNGKEMMQTNANVFSVAVQHGDLLEVKTSKSCEGVYYKVIALLDDFVVYPNPTSGLFEITLPIDLNEIKIELFTINHSLISTYIYPVINGKVQLNIESQPSAVYIANVYLENPVTVKIIKN